MLHFEQRGGKELLYLVEFTLSQQLYVIVAGLQGMTLPSLDNIYTYHCIDQIL